MIYYLFYYTEGDVMGGFADMKAYSKNLSDLLSQIGDSIWGVNTDTGEPTLVADWRQYRNAVTWDIMPGEWKIYI